MSETDVMALVRHMLWTGLLVAGPALSLALLVGLSMGVLQAATQVQESALTFVPKVAALLMLLMAGGPWALDKLVTFTDAVLTSLGGMGPGQLG